MNIVETRFIFRHKIDSSSSLDVAWNSYEPPSRHGMQWTFQKGNAVVSFGRADTTEAQCMWWGFRKKGVCGVGNDQRSSNYQLSVTCVLSFISLSVSYTEHKTKQLIDSWLLPPRLEYTTRSHRKEQKKKQQKNKYYEQKSKNKHPDWLCLEIWSPKTQNGKLKETKHGWCTTKTHTHVHTYTRLYKEFHKDHWLTRSEWFSMKAAPSFHGIHHHHHHHAHGAHTHTQHHHIEWDDKVNYRGNKYLYSPASLRERNILLALSSLISKDEINVPIALSAFRDKSSLKQRQAGGLCTGMGRRLHNSRVRPSKGELRPTMSFQQTRLNKMYVKRTSCSFAGNRGCHK